MTDRIPAGDNIEKSRAPEETRTGPVPRTWTRIRRSEQIGKQLEWSEQDKAEEDALRDLEKPIEQLLSDVHEGHWTRVESLQEGKPDGADAVELVLYTLKRTASMMAAVSKRSDEVQAEMLALTRQLRWFTAVLLVLAVPTAAPLLGKVFEIFFNMIHGNP